MEKRPVVFVSYCQKYTGLKDFFVDILEDLGFRCEVFDYGTSTSPVEAERELINKADAFIGIMTPDEKTHDGRLLCSQNVNGEISMAYGANKPIQLFAFNGVDFNNNQFSQMNTLSRVCTVNDANGRDFLFDTNNIRQIFRVLTDFKKQIDRIFEGKRESIDAFLSYRSFRIDQEIVSDTELRIHNTINAVALKNIDRHTHAGRLLCERVVGKGIRLEENDWQFKLFQPVQCKPIIRIGENEHSTFRFYIDFDPPVMAGSDLKYAYRRKHFNYFPYTLEELQEIINNGKLKSKIMATHKMIGQEFYATQPTESVTINMVFPKGYPIIKFKPLVCFGKSEQIHLSETERVSELVQLDHDEFDDIYTLRMEVPSPKINLTYYLFYTPPSQQELGETL